MSYSLNVLLVDPALPRGEVGSGDGGLCDTIEVELAQQIARADSHFSREIADGAPTRSAALRAVVAGGPFEEQYAFQYAYAYETLCEFHATPLHNAEFSPFRGDWLEQVDAGLRAVGVKAVSVTDFLYGSVPSPLPAPVDLPSYGAWSAADCAEGFAQWEASTPEQRAGLDHEVLRAVETCVHWMRQAKVTPGDGIVAFAY